MFRFEATNLPSLFGVYRSSDGAYLGTVNQHDGHWYASERVHSIESGRGRSMMRYGRDTRIEAAGDLAMFAATHERREAEQ